jgi:hypothetical protein
MTINIDLGDLDYYGLCELRNLLLRHLNEAAQTEHEAEAERLEDSIAKVRKSINGYRLSKEFSNEQ